ncbi:hypothetical protein [Coralloluteibacterium stylophorae]|uniref:Lipoprotein n=1 Tax=Coralloluteibacterium stylophorae TaxID=1776034 RepID=A0A8J8AWC5_9GAMM|nr:hypothetical protein [Coralloluteibacterium stylophorae]MBS7455528.1 hypothetical protein [Coralloluteibacterium stylophorae]
MSRASASSRLVTALVLILAASGCRHAAEDAPRAATSTATAPDTVTFAQDGISLEHPPGVRIEHRFDGGYFGPGRWKAYAPDDVPGQPLVALVLPGSDDITRAELRIGSSRDNRALATCGESPDAAMPQTRADVAINGIDFVRFDAGDSGMNHYRFVRAYRTVRDRVCYAIDLVVAGTNPEVYEPPRAAPFSREEAIARLQAMVRTLRLADAAAAGG